MSELFNIPWDRFLSLTLVNFLSVASPGPALVLMMNESMSKGRRIGTYCAAGIALGIAIHLLYTFLGLAQVIVNTPWLQKTVILVAIVFFTMFFINLIRSSGKNEYTQNTDSRMDNPGSKWVSFGKGFLVSGINPNAIVFTITMFAPLIDPNWTLLSCLLVSVWLCFNCFVVYMILNYIFSSPTIANVYFKYRHWFDRFIGFFFLYLAICFAVKLLPTEWIEPISWLFRF